MSPKLGFQLPSPRNFCGSHLESISLWGKREMKTARSGSENGLSLLASCGSSFVSLCTFLLSFPSLSFTLSSLCFWNWPLRHHPRYCLHFILSLWHFCSICAGLHFMLLCRWNPKASARKLSPNWGAGQRLAFGEGTKRSVISFRARKSDCWSRQRGNTEWKVGNNREFRLTGDHTHSGISQPPKWSN